LCFGVGSQPNAQNLSLERKKAVLKPLDVE
jgi:hypothetical protein